MAEYLFAEDKLLAAHRKLQEIQGSSLFTRKHRKICEIAEDCEAAISDMYIAEDPEDSGWTKQGESHSHHDTLIYYKIGGESRLTCFVETPIAASLLVPLLSVLNESELYSYWTPSWLRPKLGLRSSRKLKQVGRSNQIIQVVADVPWPYSTREVILQGTVVDEIDDSGYFAVILKSLNVGDDDVVAAPDPNVQRVDFEGVLLFRACPPDHPMLLKSDHRHREPMVLVSFKM
jgi:hypothetical protein